MDNIIGSIVTPLNKAAKLAHEMASALLGNKITGLKVDLTFAYSLIIKKLLFCMRQNTFNRYRTEVGHNLVWD
ncbi:hypothetical protein GCM10027085_49670 [Spirosoma aerophilum]